VVQLIWSRIGDALANTVLCGIPWSRPPSAGTHWDKAGPGPA